MSSVDLKKKNETHGGTVKHMSQQTMGNAETVLTRSENHVWKIPEKIPEKSARLEAYLKRSVK